MKKTILSLTLLAVALLVGACSDQENPVGVPHPLGGEWLVDTGSGTFHGDQADADCLTCHDPDSFCFRCHFGPDGDRVPSGVDWTHGNIDGHNTDPLQDVGAVCDRCHDLTQRYRGSPENCHTCHEGPGIPHPLDADWFLPGGDTFHATSDLDCEPCHGPREDFCSECHFGPDGAKSPDPDLWDHGLQDHAAGSPFDFKGDPSVYEVCVRCHEVENEYVLTERELPTTCTNCHDFDMHDEDFFSDHMAAAKENLLACRPCHDTPSDTPNFDGYVSGVACSGCHDEALAHPVPWRFEAGATRTHASAGNIPAACAICHNVADAGASPLPEAPPCAECHEGGIGTLHPMGAQWLDPSAHGAAAKENLSSCGQCHSDNPGGANPRFNEPFTSFSQGCESCHEPFTAHPVPWVGHQEAQNRTESCDPCHAGTAPVGPECSTCHGELHSVPWLEHGAAAEADADSCRLCHGDDLGGEYGPACETCHGLDPLANAGCTSCHNDPPDGADPAAADYPNREGAHPEHLALPTPGIGCATCHQDAVAGTQTHYDAAAEGVPPAVVAIASTYDAQSGAATFNANGADGGTCSDVSCHGGPTTEVATPNWLTGTLNVASDCEACHEVGGGQANSPDSGAHATHVLEEGIGCTTCHDPALLTPELHFDDLDTAAMDQGAQTIRESVGYNGDFCTGACHGNWSWQ